MAAERLENGFDPETPPDDSVLRRFLVGYREWMEKVATLPGRRLLLTDDFVALDESSPDLMVNHAVVQRPLDRHVAESVAGELLAFFGGAPGGPFAVFNPWPKPTLPGFTVGGFPPFMFRAVGSAAPPEPPELEVREVSSSAELADYERVIVEGYPLDALRPWQRGCLLDPASVEVPGWRFWVGRVDGDPVAAAAAIGTAGVNYVELVATMPDARGRGYGEALTWRATAADPENPAILIASDLGRSVYERMGYVALFRFAFLTATR